MNIDTLLSPSTRNASFLRDYFHRLPFSLANAARSVCPLGSWDVLGQILSQGDVDAMVVRDGRQYEGPDPRNLEEARKLSGQGYTILVRHAERHHAGLEQLAVSFEADFHAPANIHIYATPPGKYGFSWHYDAEDVFIMQTSGQKKYALRKNTVNPWPLNETIPDDMRYEREIMPLMRVLLAAGDWLYIPCGYWHRAEAPPGEQTAISLALGVMSRSAVEVYDSLRPRLLESLLWRQRLPVYGHGEATDEELLSQYKQMFEQLGDDLAKIFRDERFVREFCRSVGL